ncbi:MAG TPA: hypothetical protein VK031_07420 [Tissierellaceae bacterium]|nr:hypothetical protein [Tissierellaceae bacterium]
MASITFSYNITPNLKIDLYRRKAGSTASFNLEKADLTFDDSPYQIIVPSGHSYELKYITKDCKGNQIGDAKTILASKNS